MELTRTRCFDRDGNIFYVPVTVKEEGNAYHCTVKQADIENAAKIDILPQVGETEASDGWILVSYLHFEGIIMFSPKDKDNEYTVYPKLHFYGVKNEKGTFMVVYDSGMFAQTDLFFGSKEGVRNIYFSLSLARDGLTAYDDVNVTVYKLDDGADYNTMAKIYRKLQQEKGLKSIKEKNRKAVTYAAESMEIRVRMAWKPVPTPVDDQTPETEPPVHIAVTFDRLKEIMTRLHDRGVEKAEFCLVGWNKSGHDGRFPQMFPVEEKLGGEEKLKEVIAYGQKLGYKVVCHTNSYDSYTIADCFNINDIVLDKNGNRECLSAGWSGGRAYHICSVPALEYAKQELPKVKALGFEGLHYIDVLSLERPLLCLDKNHYCTRDDTLKNWNELADFSASLFGGFASEGSADTMVRHIDYALYGGFLKFQRKATEFNYVQLPLWDIVFHGSVLATPSSEMVNISLCDRDMQLKFIEYGGRPSMYVYSRFVTESASRGNWMGKDDLRCETDEELDASVNALKAADDLYAPLKRLQFEFIEEHKYLNPTLVRVTYGDGTRLYVNYSLAPITVDGVEIAAKDYTIV